MKLSTREAIIGIVTYRLLRYGLGRYVSKKGGLMASKKKIGILAAIGAAIAGLMFWRKKKQHQEVEQL
jgi:hypothetical protein